MPGGSSVRSLRLKSLKATKKWNRSSTQGWLNLMPHCPPRLEFQLQLNATKSARFIHRAQVLSSCISLGQDEERRKYQAGGGRKQKMPPQPAKVRTKMSAKPGSRGYQAAALSGRCRRNLWKQQEMKSTKYSGLTQSHALSLTTTRALTSTLRTRKLHCQMQQNWPSSFIEQELYLAASCWAKANEEEENIRLKEERNKRYLRNQRKYIQRFQQSQGVEDARRQLCQVIEIETSESSKQWNRSNFQGRFNLMPHYPPPLELWLQLSALESCVDKYNQIGWAHP